VNDDVSIQQAVGDHDLGVARGPVVGVDQQQITVHDVLGVTSRRRPSRRTVARLGSSACGRSGQVVWVAGPSRGSSTTTGVVALRLAA
jgi:hypothetical protein